jgi:beta-fructofuranosidase
MGEWYYLVFSEYTTRTGTRYVMSRSIEGPWVAPKNNQFDNRAFYAAKTAGDGNRRFVFGWNGTKSGNDDNEDWQWGGCLTVHEVVQNDDGTLSVRMPPEAEQAFADPAPVRLEVSDTGWRAEGGSYRVESPYAYSAVFGERMPDTYLLEGELTFERDAGEAGVLLGVDSEGDAGYFLRFNLDGQALQFGKVGGYRFTLSLPFPNCYVDHMPELDRPLAIRAGVPLRYKIVVDKSAIVAYVDDHVALSGRMYAAPFGRCGLFADGTTVSVAGFASRAIRESRSEASRG